VEKGLVHTAGLLGPGAGVVAIAIAKFEKALMLQREKATSGVELLDNQISVDQLIKARRILFDSQCELPLRIRPLIVANRRLG
jgi:hypothetical protein